MDMKISGGGSQPPVYGDKEPTGTSKDFDIKSGTNIEPAQPPSPINKDNFSATALKNWLQWAKNQISRGKDIPENVQQFFKDLKGAEDLIKNDPSLKSNPEINRVFIPKIDQICDYINKGRLDGGEIGNKLGAMIRALG